jgi:hypothetical protein
VSELADQNARAHAEDVREPPRWRRDLRRVDDELAAALIGILPAATPDTLSQPDSGHPVTRKASWTDAAAAVDAADRVFQTPNMR